ncbi:chromate transporter [Patescibacteria group bacterium]|nr:MAG: chromate transporter [Patescibacteria group bacterium]
MATSQPPKELMGWLEYYLVTKAPFQIPPNAREWIVKYSPWINIVLLVLFAPAILLALGVGAALVPFSAVGGASAATGLSFALVALVLQVGLMIAALPGLFARKKIGWQLVFYSVVLNLIFSLLNFNIVGGLLSAVLGSYVLFQIKSYYK